MTGKPHSEDMRFSTLTSGPQTKKTTFHEGNKPPTVCVCLRNLILFFFVKHWPQQLRLFCNVVWLFVWTCREISVSRGVSWTAHMLLRLRLPVAPFRFTLHEISWDKGRFASGCALEWWPEGLVSRRFPIAAFMQGSLIGYPSKFRTQVPIPQQALQVEFNLSKCLVPSTGFTCSAFPVLCDDVWQLHITGI